MGTSPRRASRRGGTWWNCAPRTPAKYTVGQELTADVFDGVAKVDVIGTSKGKGTAGVMKRHGFKGLGAGHGTQRKHRVAGLHRWRVDPRSRVQGPARWPAAWAHVKTTTLSLVVHKVDAERGLLLIKGAVPGPKGGLLLVRSAVKGGPVGSDNK